MKPKLLLDLALVVGEMNEFVYFQVEVAITND